LKALAKNWPKSELHRRGEKNYSFQTLIGVIVITCLISLMDFDSCRKKIGLYSSKEALLKNI
jgi:hypothetical protein